MSARKILFGYWSDPLCIWAFVAENKLTRILAAHGDVLDVEFRIVPVFGSIPRRFASGSWAQKGVEGRVEATARIAREHGMENVDGAIWRDDRPASSWTAGAAIKAVGRLEKRGEIEPGTVPRYLHRLRERFFVDNVNVCRRGTQLELAEELGIDVAKLTQLLDDGTAIADLYEDFLDKEELRIKGSPTYVFDDGRAMLYGNFAYGILEATVQELVRGVHPGSTAC